MSNPIISALPNLTPVLIVSKTTGELLTWEVFYERALMPLLGRFEMHKSIVHLYLLHEENNDVYFEKSHQNLERVKAKSDFFDFYGRWYKTWEKALVEKDVGRLIALHLWDSYEGDELRKHSLSDFLLTDDEHLAALDRVPRRGVGGGSTTPPLF